MSKQKEDKKMVITLAMSKSVLGIVDDIATKKNVSRSYVIESIVRGWINATIKDVVKDFAKENQDESRN